MSRVLHIRLLDCEVWFWGTFRVILANQSTAEREMSNEVEDACTGHISFQIAWFMGLSWTAENEGHGILSSLTISLPSHAQ